MLLVIDERVALSPEHLSQLSDNVDIMTIAPTDDGLKKLNHSLANSQNTYSSVHIITHGSAGRITLGATAITSDNLAQYAADLSAFGAQLTDEADVLLYACDLAEGESGQAFIEELARLTQADVAASNDITGDSGDWQLEVMSGEITNQAFRFAGVDALTSRPSVLLGGILSPGEDSAISGLSVSAADSTLMGRVVDIDGDNNIVISSFQSDIDLSTPKTVFVSFVDPIQNQQQSIALTMTINADGSYSLQTATELDAKNLAKLGENRIAAGTFTYTVQDSTGLDSLVATGVLQVMGANDAPEVTANTVLAIKEDAVTIGSASYGQDSVSVGPGLQPLATGLLGNFDNAVTDTIVSSVGVANVPANGGRIVSLSFTDNDQLSQVMDVTVLQDGSVSFDSSDFTWIPNGETVSASFTYQVQDPTLRVSGIRTATVTITGGSTPDFGLNIVSDKALITHVYDIDDTKTRIKVAEINGQSVSADTALTLPLTYTTPAGETATVDFTLIVEHDGGISFEPQDIQQLGLGESATGTFTYRLRDANGALTDEQTATVELQGQNDQPQIRGDLAGTVMASENARFVNGSIKVYDIDQGEAGLASFIIDENDTRLELDSQGSVTGTYGTWLIDTDTGTYSYALDVDNSTVSGLATSETLTEVVTFTSADGTLSKDVVITIQGPSVAPQISLGPNDSATGSVAENLTEYGVFGTISVSDENAFQTVSADVANVVVSGRSDGLNASPFQLRSLLYFVDPLAVKSGATSGTLNWGFSSQSVDFSYLSASESVTLSFAVRLLDERLEETLQTIEVTVTGVDSPASINVPDLTLSSQASQAYNIDLSRYISDNDFASAPTLSVTLTYPDGSPVGDAPLLTGTVLTIAPDMFGSANGERVQVTVSAQENGVTLTDDFTITLNSDAAPSGLNVSPHINTLNIVPIRETGAERTEYLYTYHDIDDTPL